MGPSRHVCSKMFLELEDVRGLETGKHTQSTKRRILLDKFKISEKSDKDGICAKIAKCIYPCIPSKHPAELVNVHSGLLAPSTVNVQNTVEIAKERGI